MPPWNKGVGLARLQLWGEGLTEAVGHTGAAKSTSGRESQAFSEHFRTTNWTV